MSVSVITLTADTSQIESALDHIACRIAELREQAEALRGLDAEIAAAAFESDQEHHSEPLALLAPFNKSRHR